MTGEKDFTKFGIAMHKKADELVVAAKAGNRDGALADYSEAIRLQPEHHQALHLRGALLRNRGDVEGGLKDLDEAIRLKPDVITVDILMPNKDGCKV